MIVAAWRPRSSCLCTTRAQVAKRQREQQCAGGAAFGCDSPASALVNQLVEAQRDHSLSRMLARWSRVELIVIDELDYVSLAEVAAELLFRVTYVECHNLLLSSVRLARRRTLRGKMQDFYNR